MKEKVGEKESLEKVLKDKVVEKLFAKSGKGSIEKGGIRKGGEEKESREIGEAGKGGDGGEGIDWKGQKKVVPKVGIE